MNNYLKTSIYLSMLLTVFLMLPNLTHAATSVTQYGITWNFDKDYTVGQFVNGDYWVVDPGTGVKIVNITPGYATSPNKINGSMLNPTSEITGYDDRIAYSDSANVGIGISGATPLVLTGNVSLVSTISNFDEAQNASAIDKAAVLTCLATAPPAGSFRPGYSGTNKVLYNENNINKALLAKLAVPAGQAITAATLTNYASKHQMAWIDHNGTWTARYMHPASSGIDNYYYAPIFAESALLLQLNFTDAEKYSLLINYMQLGIDLYSYINSGANGWPPDGGHSSGRKWPILFAGVMLNDTAMKNIGQKSGDYLYANGHGPQNQPSDYINFGEDGQTLYVAQSDVDVTNSGLWNPDVRTAPNYPYTSAMIGMPEWAIRYSTDPSRSDSSWGANYRTIGSGAPAWAGTSLAARIMGAKSLWNYNAHFDYMDRYMAITKGDPDPFGYTVPSEGVWGRPTGFIGAMWDTYRASYNDVVNDATPPSSPTGLSVL